MQSVRARAGANNKSNVFDRGAYVVEHTVRPANVRTAFCARENCRGP